jgi:hypothetical protein
LSETETEKTDSLESDVEFSRTRAELPESTGSPSPKKRRSKRTLIFPKLVCVMDSRKVSDRATVHIFIAVVETLGENVDDFIINRTSIQRCRKILREERVGILKDQFKECDLQAMVLH